MSPLYPKRPLRRFVSLSLIFFLYLVMLPFVSSQPGLAKKGPAPASSKSAQDQFPQQPNIPIIPAGSAYRQTNLVSDIPGLAPLQDPLLVNPWGISMTSSSTFWVANNGTSTAQLIRDPNGLGPVVLNPSPQTVTIPGGLPTGTVSNTSNDFILPGACAVAPCPARFLFASITGNITGWNANAPAAGSTQAVIAASHPGHTYTGLAIGSNSGGNRLYAADFNNGNIDVYNGTYTLTTTTGGFADPTIPTTAGNTFHPYNIQNIGGSLYVMYAKVGTGGHAEPGVGNGFVRRFNTDGVRDLTFGINNGPLNAPWGIAIAPSSFGLFGGALLIGNFGEGNPSIHAFNPTTGAFLGTIQNENGDGIVIDELWALVFGNGGSGGDVNTLYFSAGPAEEEHGLFGKLNPTTAAATSLIQFSTDEYAIGEGSGHIDVTVTRSGDASGSASVSYNTFDESIPGHASQKSDYEIALGSVNFAPGETSKTFRILIVNDAFVEGDETVSLALSNPTGSGVGLGSPNTATLRILDNEIPAPAITLRSATGANPAAITPARDLFRSDVGGGTTLGANGSFGGVRREINWDGVPQQFAAPNNLPTNFFNSNSPRGVVFSTPGTGFQVSGASTDGGAGQPAAQNFGNINATYITTFQQFSAQRLFTALGSTVTDVNFFVAGTSTPATVTSFGAIFTDVDTAGAARMLFFDASNVLMTDQEVPAQAGSGNLSFLGLTINNRPIGRVRIISGNAALSPNDNPPATDVAVMDDFIYSEPVTTVLPSLPNPIDDAQFFVRQHYLDFLNREPDTAGFNFWVNQITSCGVNAACIADKRINVSAAFFLSIEFQQTGLLAYLTHRAAFGNTTVSGSPGPILYGEFEREVQALQKDFVFGSPGGDAQLEANKQAYFNAFVNKPEFISKYGGLTNAQYVDTLLATAGLSPTDFVVSLTNSQEVPPTNPTTTTGTRRPNSFGTSTFHIDDTLKTMTVNTTVFNLDINGTQTTDTNDNLTNAHIHAGASVAPGVNGPVVWGFFGSPYNDTTPDDHVVTPLAPVGGTFFNKWDDVEGNGGTTLTAQLANIRAGRAYINFHTSQFGGGEIRGNFPATQPFRDNLVAGLDALTETRASVLRKVAESADLKQREFNSAFVLMEYFGYLRRDADSAGFNFWLRKLNEFSGNFLNADMVKAFITSSEYRQRFGPS